MIRTYRHRFSQNRFTGEAPELPVTDEFIATENFNEIVVEGWLDPITIESGSLDPNPPSVMGSEGMDELLGESDTEILTE